MRWHVAKPCHDCPFNKDGEGRAMRRSLRPGRWRSILRALRRGSHFSCHNTTSLKHPLICAGSMQWEDAHGLESDARQVMQRLELARKMSE